MPKFNANLTMLFNEVDFLDRFDAAAKAGFNAVEYLFPYPYPKEQLAERLAKDNQVLLLDRFFHDQPITFTSLHNNSNVRMVEADILEGAEVKDLAREADIVIHAAAIVGVGRVCSYPRETLETNFIGTSRILPRTEAVHRMPAACGGGCKARTRTDEGAILP